MCMGEGGAASDQVSADFIEFIDFVGWLGGEMVGWMEGFVRCCVWGWVCMCSSPEL